MTYLTKRVIIVLLGLLGGLFAWPLIEACISLQPAFPSYFLFTACYGVLAGAVMGAFFASAEGLTASLPNRALRGALGGLVTGLLGGIAGAFAAQTLLFLAGQSLTQGGGDQLAFRLLLARASAWAIIGAAIGMSEGVRARSFKKWFLGLIGGLVGGFLGGLLLVWMLASFPTFYLGRLLALMLMGGLISLLYSLLEKQFALGSLKILNGLLKGKEFLINQRKLTLGTRHGEDIVLKGYHDVVDRHAFLRVHGGVVTLSAQDGTIRVNEDLVEKSSLKLDDVIQIGSAKILYGYFG